MHYCIYIGRAEEQRLEIKSLPKHITARIGESNRLCCFKQNHTENLVWVFVLEVPVSLLLQMCENSSL